MTPSSNALNSPLSLETPDCIRCLRKKLGAIGVAHFFKHAGEWLLADFESDTPRSDSEFQGTYLLEIGLPQIIADSESGFILSTNEAIQSKFPGINALFNDCSVIGVRTVCAGFGGVRFAWREQSLPFSERDLKVLECFGECPPGCSA